MSNKRNTKIAPKPFCKVCFDAGLPESKYTNHFVKSEPGPQGKTVCPTLLSQECRYCFGLGHTAGYCPIIAENKKMEEKAKKEEARAAASLKREEEQKAPKPAAAKKSSNMFAAAFDSSESDEEVSKKKVSKPILKKSETIRGPSTIQVPASILAAPIKQTVKHTAIVPAKPRTKEEEFPALPSKPKTVTAPVTMSGYASVAAKTPEEFQREVYEQQLIENSMKRQIKPLTATKSQAQATKTTAAAASVQDYYDSWDEDEEEVEPPKPAYKSITNWAAACYSDDEDW
jgi:hypothetical protein